MPHCVLVQIDAGQEITYLALMGLVTDLQTAIKSKNIRFTRDVTPAAFAKRYMRQVTVFVGSHQHIFQLDDEFSLIDSAAPELLLNMLLMECTWYEEEEDYLAWCTSKGLDAGNSIVLAYYRQLGERVTAVRKRLPNLGHTSFFDWQLNAGDAQTLRKLAAKSP